MANLGRRLAVGVCVLLLHVLAVSGFIFQPRFTTPMSPSVEVRLLPDKVVEERMQPPPVPVIVMRPVVVAMPPLVVQEAPAPPSQAPPATAPQGSSVASGPPAPKTAPPPSSDYLRRLAAHILAYKKFQYETRKSERGVVRLHLIFDRNGHVLSCTVAESSGSAMLDEEALALIRRAEPLPPVPADYPGETVDLIVPVMVSFN